MLSLYLASLFNSSSKCLGRLITTNFPRDHELIHATCPDVNATPIRSKALAHIVHFQLSS